MYSKAKIDQIYGSESYAKNNYFSDELSGDITLSQRRVKDYDRALKYVEKMEGTGRLLDIGCGAGVFLGMAKARGWDVSGVELSPKLASLCRQQLNVPVANGQFEDTQLPLAAYDVVTLWDVIEHVIDPMACLLKIKGLVRPGGILIFCTPDEDSLLARTGLALYKATASRYSYPAFALHPPYHTYFFSRKGFIRVLNELDMRVINSYSQEAFFEHSDLATPLQKLGITLIEKAAGLIDRRYEMVVFARVGTCETTNTMRERCRT
ncbi:class I SAM-dependent methyltransferase [Nitrospira sp. Nam80]